MRLRTNFFMPKSSAKGMNKNSICNAYKKCSKNASSLPPMKFTQSMGKFYLIDRNSPFTSKDYKILFGVSNLTQIKTLAKKLNISVIDKNQTKESLKGSIIEYLKKHNIQEPILIPARCRVQAKKSSINLNSNNNNNTNLNSNNNNNTNLNSNNMNMNMNRNRNNMNMNRNRNNMNMNMNRNRNNTNMNMNRNRNNNNNKKPSMFGGLFGPKPVSKPIPVSPTPVPAPTFGAPAPDAAPTPIFGAPAAPAAPAPAPAPKTGGLFGQNRQQPKTNNKIPGANALLERLNQAKRQTGNNNR
jgi:hypothetical protein